MKHRATILVILVALYSSLTLADDFKTINGKEYKNAKVSRVEPDGIVLVTKSGISKVYFTELPKDVQERFHYDSGKVETEKAAAKAAEEKRIEEQKAAQREDAEREKSAEADLKQAVEQFQAAEQQASQTYQSATKGTLSGQVFVSSRGGENFKLGAVQVGLFARDAIDALLPAMKKYADYKIQQLSGAVAEAKAAQDQAEANEKTASGAVTRAIRAGRRDYRAEERASDDAIQAVAITRQQYSEINDKLNYCYSGGFYFAALQSPIHTAETDAEGKFVIEVPRTGRFVIAAQARRSVGDYTEHYYWLQPVSLEGQQQVTQNLSNNNLTSTTGTSSLILTKD
jgi:hypothetical protein